MVPLILDPGIQPNTSVFSPMTCNVVCGVGYATLYALE